MTLNRIKQRLIKTDGWRSCLKVLLCWKDLCLCWKHETCGTPWKIWLLFCLNWTCRNGDISENVTCLPKHTKKWAIVIPENTEMVLDVMLSITVPKINKHFCAKLYAVYLYCALNQRSKIVKSKQVNQKSRFKAKMTSTTKISTREINMSIIPPQSILCGDVSFYTDSLTHIRTSRP